MIQIEWLLTINMFSDINFGTSRGTWKCPRSLPVGHASMFKTSKALLSLLAGFVWRTILNKEPDRLNEQGKDVRPELRAGAPAAPLRVPGEAQKSPFKSRGSAP